MVLKVKSSARLTRRYLLIKGNKKNITKAILDYVGTLGWAKAAPHFVKKEGTKQILAINRSEIDPIRGALAISENNLTVEKVSGTIKGLGLK